MAIRARDSALVSLYKRLNKSLADGEKMRTNDFPIALPDPAEAFRDLCRKVNQRMKGMDSRGSLAASEIRELWDMCQDEKKSEILAYFLWDYLKLGFLDWDKCDNSLILYRKLDPQLSLLDFLAYKRFRKGRRACQSMVPGLDTILKGGFLIPGDEGIQLVIKGAPGTGKTTLALQLAYEFAKQRQTVLYVVAEQSAQSIDTVMSRFQPTNKKDVYVEWLRNAKGENVPEKVGRLIFAHWPPRRFTREASSFQDPGDSEAIAQVVEGVRDEVDEIEAHPHWLVVDSANAIPGMLFRNQLMQTRLQLKQIDEGQIGLSVIYVSEERYPGKRTFTDEEFAADMVIELGHRHFQIGSGPNPSNDYDQRYLEITKSRHQSVHRGQHPLAIKDHGIVVHSSSAIAFKITSKTAHPLEHKELFFGIEGIDNLVNGSIVDGTTTLLTGNAITQKLGISLNFLAKGLEDGKNCALYYFTDNRPEVDALLNSYVYGNHNDSMAKIFEDKISHHVLDIRCLTPGYLFPEDFLGNLEKEIHERPAYKKTERERVGDAVLEILGPSVKELVDKFRRSDETSSEDGEDNGAFEEMNRSEHSSRGGRTPSIVRRMVFADVDKIAAQFPIIYTNEFFFQTLFQILRKYGISCVIIDSALPLDQRRRSVDLGPLVDSVIDVSIPKQGEDKRARVLVRSTPKMVHKREEGIVDEDVTAVRTEGKQFVVKLRVTPAKKKEEEDAQSVTSPKRANPGGLGSG